MRRCAVLIEGTLEAVGHDNNTVFIGEGNAALCLFNEPQASFGASADGAVLHDLAQILHALEISDNVVLHVRQSFIKQAAYDRVLLKMRIQRTHLFYAALGEHHGIDAVTVAAERANAAEHEKALNELGGHGRAKPAKQQTDVFIVDRLGKKIESNAETESQNLHVLPPFNNIFAVIV